MTTANKAVVGTSLALPHTADVRPKMKMLVNVSNALASVALIVSALATVQYFAAASRPYDAPPVATIVALSWLLWLGWPLTLVTTAIASVPAISTKSFWPLFMPILSALPYLAVAIAAMTGFYLTI